MECVLHKVGMLECLVVMYVVCWNLLTSCRRYAEICERHVGGILVLCIFKCVYVIKKVCRLSEGNVGGIINCV